jgi:DNA-binding Lrp family transcriptional regulator
MLSFETSHNANLHNTVSDSTPIVNFIDRGEGNGASYDVKNAPPKLFVKISNRIYDQGLTPREIEFYCFLVYYMYSEPNTRLSILVLRALIIKQAGQSINKDTINAYLNTLISKGLIIRRGKYYYAPLPMIPLDKRVSRIDGSCTNNLYIPTELTTNMYIQPKDNYTPFFITAYNHNTTRASLALELYLASKPFNRHRPSKVCKDLNISRKTYYKYINELLQKKIIKRVHIAYNHNEYLNTYRLMLLDDYTEIKEARYYYQGHDWRSKKQAATAHSRLWFASPMGVIMKEYKINYIKAFDNYNPQDAYLIVKDLFNQYGPNIQAPLIVKAILDAYNWIKIQERRHAKIKREQAKLLSYQGTQECFLDFMQC